MLTLWRRHTRAVTLTSAAPMPTRKVIKIEVAHMRRDTQQSKEGLQKLHHSGKETGLLLATLGESQDGSILKRRSGIKWASSSSSKLLDTEAADIIPGHGLKFGTDASAHKLEHASAHKDENSDRRKRQPTPEEMAVWQEYQGLPQWKEPVWPVQKTLSRTARFRAALAKIGARSSKGRRARSPKEESEPKEEWEPIPDAYITDPLQGEYRTGANFQASPEHRFVAPTFEESLYRKPKPGDFKDEEEQEIMLADWAKGSPQWGGPS